jgi:rRNA-processing protein CGR1
MKVSTRTKLSSGWLNQQKERARLLAARTLESELKAEKAAEIQGRKDRALDNATRREANAKRAEVYQAISSRKVKRMSKRQLRQLTQVPSAHTAVSGLI